MLRGCGFHWQLGGFDPAQNLTPLVILRLYWRNGLTPKRDWGFYAGGFEHGLLYREHTPRRSGSWMLRGPWQKVA